MKQARRFGAPCFVWAFWASRAVPIQDTDASFIGSSGQYDVGFERRR
jgi:hypothetical protein